VPYQVEVLRNEDGPVMLARGETVAEALALAALEGYADLPRGEELERLAGLAQLSNATAYSARKIPPPAPRAKPGRS
jgi:hypothetical protein